MCCRHAIPIVTGASIIQEFYVLAATRKIASFFNWEVRWDGLSPNHVAMMTAAPSQRTAPVKSTNDLNYLRPPIKRPSHQLSSGRTYSRRAVRHAQAGSESYGEREVPRKLLIRNQGGAEWRAREAPRQEPLKQCTEKLARGSERGRGGRSPAEPRPSPVR